MRTYVTKRFAAADDAATGARHLAPEDERAVERHLDVLGAAVRVNTRLVVVLCSRVSKKQNKRCQDIIDVKFDRCAKSKFNSSLIYVCIPKILALLLTKHAYPYPYHSNLCWPLECNEHFVVFPFIKWREPHVRIVTCAIDTVQ